MGGFPVAARSFQAAALDGRCTRTEAATSVAALTCSGPAFVVTAVGVGMCGSRTLGYLLLLGQWAAALTLYLPVVLRKKRTEMKRSAAPCQPLSQTLVTATRKAALSMGVICAFVLLFAALTAVLEAVGVFGLLADLPEAAVRGLLEVTMGCRAAARCSGLWSVTVLSFLLGFGGLCVWAQVLALAPRLPLGRYLPLRLAFGVLAALYTRLLLFLFPVTVPAFAPVMGRASNSWLGSLLLFLLCVLLISTGCHKKERIPESRLLANGRSREK